MAPRIESLTRGIDLALRSSELPVADQENLQALLASLREQRPEELLEMSRELGTYPIAAVNAQDAADALAPDVQALQARGLPLEEIGQMVVDAVEWQSRYGEVPQSIMQTIWDNVREMVHVKAEAALRPPTDAGL